MIYDLRNTANFHDVFIIGINNHASSCMDIAKTISYNLEQSKSCTLTKGIAGGLEVSDYGIVHKNIMDYSGQVHHLAVKQAAHVFDLSYALLLPKYWS